jgi:hypothetical protein
VTTKCSISPNVWSDVTVTKSFTTLALPVAMSFNVPAITPEKSLTPHDIKISPNPASYSTTISAVFVKTENVFIGIYDTEGRLMNTLMDNSINKGHLQLKWNIRNVKPGVYFLRIKTASYSETRKLEVIN